MGTPSLITTPSSAFANSTQAVILQNSGTKAPENPVCSCPNDPCSGIGLANEKNTTEYVADMKKLQAEWPKLTPEQREVKMESALNKQIAKGGGAHVPLEKKAFGDSRSGEFDPATRRIRVNQALIDKNTLADKDAMELSDTLYHEARHAEQFQMIDDKSGKDPCRAACGKKVYESIYGTGRKHRDDTLTNIGKAGQDMKKYEASMAALTKNPSATPAQIKAAQDGYNEANSRFQKLYPDYRALPEEADAWRTGDAVKAKW